MMDDTAKSGGPRGNRWRIAVWGTLAAIELLPLVAMQFTREVAWTWPSFVLLGVMLAIVGGGFELATRMSRNVSYRAAAGIALVAGFVLIWMNLAVGIIGNEDNPANLMFFGVHAVGIAGALIARFRAAGMARVMVAMALAQLAVAVAAQLNGDFIWPLTVVFAGLWLGSAALFRKAAREQAAA